jgi:hypothetical protein
MAPSVLLFGLDETYGDQQPEPSAAEEKQAMIRQVRLKGTTIRQAWFNNKQSRDLEPSTNFSPDEFGGRDVFHSTDHQLNSPLWCQAWNDTPFTLAVSRTMNQMAPRCFLWRSHLSAPSGCSCGRRLSLTST